jgi:isopentenyl diphosphate isomerase/L-lactate dehydrogenase-like FMN-dependent dehydrogenase
VAGFALPFVRAHQEGGAEAARAQLVGVLTALRAAFLLCGARNAVALRASRPVILEPLSTWIEGLGE